ncbi:hypothetical protein KO493_03285 [Tamlana agarivorans]|uniref:Uncharacterized protein n=1 Tax=Pseudotamlana agarivorans TaxID=481183 RepID=A0ACC5U5W7_9FLAO|nr:hypothetical protein [Tamlana agarivorans]MBU2949717.1 hypothetical protein [Tamlana agarivorans]
MKQFKFFFAIGEQYELHEFDLEELDVVLIEEYAYDVYKCSTKLLDVFELDGLVDINLYYNADILARVDYYFKIDLGTLTNGVKLPSKKGEIRLISNYNEGFCLVIAGSKYKFNFNSGKT